MIVREEYTGKVERLLKEAMGWDSETETYNQTMVTKISWEDNEVMVLQLNNETLVPIWRQTQWPSKRKSSQCGLFSGPCDLAYNVCYCQDLCQMKLSVLCSLQNTYLMCSISV